MRHSGGYLEGKLNGHFPITRWADFNPYGIISVSFRDRVEPGSANSYGGRPLTVWNHVRAGAESPIHLAHLGGSSPQPIPLGRLATTVCCGRASSS